MTIDYDVDAAHLLQSGIAFHNAGRADLARDMYQRALRREPRNFQAWHLLGVIEFQSNRPQRALELLTEALSIDPDHAPAHNHRGNALLALGQYDSAIDSYARAIGFWPHYSEAHYNLGNAYFDLGRHEAAIFHYDRAIASRTEYAAAYNNRGLANFCLARFRDAIADYDRALAIDPAVAEAHCNRGHALRDSGDHAAALAGYDAAIAIAPQLSEAHNGRGATLSLLKRYASALESFDRAIALRQNFAEAHLNRGNVHRELRRWGDALDAYDRAIAIDDKLTAAHLNRADMLKQLRRPEDAIASYDRAIAVNPDLAEAYYGRGDALRHMERFEAAVADFDKAAELKPDLDFLQGIRRHVRMALCDWNGIDGDIDRLRARIENGEPAVPPFALLALSGSAALQRQAARIWVRDTCAPNDELGGMIPHLAHERIRVGYFSADFRNHPVTYLAAELFEVHDRSRFEFIAFSLAPDTGDAMSLRVRAAFEHFVDAGQHSDRDIAVLARQLELDIAIDLGGFTEGGRPGIFALRAAPLQVGYLGYLGTLGAPYMDYLIADTTLVPSDFRRYYDEKLLLLPIFQANDSKRPIADRSFDRDTLGLPAKGFVFACFNSNYKITPQCFDAWMRILRGVPGSVLFLYADNPSVERNLCNESRRRGVDPARLVFAGRMPLPDHLARYRAADLFLDTYPYNAGTTASDALWAGLPVLTLTGEAFASRMAASVLTAVGLPELVCTTPERYEKLAIELAEDAPRLAAIRRQLADNRQHGALFDTPRFARHLEAGYEMIHARRLEGAAPEHLTVPAAPP